MPRGLWFEIHSELKVQTENHALYGLSPVFRVGSGAGAVEGGPGAVENLSASAGDGEVTLSWTRPTSDETPTNYEYSYTTDRTEPFRNWTTVSGGGAARSVTVSGLTNGAATRVQGAGAERRRRWHGSI